MLTFRPLTADCGEMVRSYVRDTACRNCDLCFMNLIGWRFRYDTEVAEHEGLLLFRFRADGHNAYLAPVGNAPWQAALADLIADAQARQEPFLMLGVCENTLARLNEAMPGYFYASANRDYADYIYLRERLATLSGKKLQSKRNFAQRFFTTYPTAEVLELTPALFDECRALERQWQEAKPDAAENTNYEAERRAFNRVLDHWDAFNGRGIALRVDGRIVAYTYGAPINHDTFDVCMEKADTRYVGAYAAINRSFAASLPEQYVYVNREEDLGVEGLRTAKLSYKPEILLHKYTVMAKHPLGTQHP